MINVSGVTFAWSDKPLFEGVNFTVGKGQKIGLIGPNGSGKTTLLNLLLKREFPKEGEIEVIGSIGFVPQEVKRDEDLEKAKSVRDYVDPKFEILDFELKKMLSNLELGNLDLDAKPISLSGGQKTKLALARALISKPDVLLLDEPTNFMDISGKKWVMEFLGNYPKALILISHDLKLMDNSIDKLLFINPQTKKIEEYKGNYTKAMKMKKDADELLKRKITVEKKHIKNMEEGLKKLYKYTSKKGVRARVMLERRIERLRDALPDIPPELKSIKVNLPEPARVEELPLRVINVSKSYGSLEVLKDVNFSIRRGERIALIGPNGAGKSTFLKIITGRLSPDSGEVIKSQNLKYGYYSQEFETFDLTKTVLQTFTDDTNKDDSFGRAFLGRYMFMENKVFQNVATLSGGEKTRLSIACLTGHDYNLLILDEPTTYLDVTSQRIILEALKLYKGAMIIVSHTQEFIKELGPSRALLFPENRFTFWSDDLLDKVGDISNE